jgi:hypothetical protein
MEAVSSARSSVKYPRLLRHKEKARFTVVTAAAPLVHSSRRRKIGSAKEAGWLLGGAKVKGYHPPVSAGRPGGAVNEMAIVVPAGAATSGGVHVVL